MYRNNYTDELSDLLFSVGNNNLNFIDLKNEIKLLIEKGADVNATRYYSGYDEEGNYIEGRQLFLSYISNSLAHFLNKNIELFERYAQIIEILILNGAKINFRNHDDYTPLDYLLMCEPIIGVNQSTYRLCKIMLTSLNKKEMNDYLLLYKHPETFIMLESALKVFGKYEEHMQYMF